MPRAEGRRPGFVEAAEDMVCRFIVPAFDHYARFFIEGAQAAWTPADGFTLRRPQLRIMMVPTLLRRPVEAASARAVIRAIVERKDVEVDYLSPAYESPRIIRMTPTGLGFRRFPPGTSAHTATIMSSNRGPHTATWYLNAWCGGASLNGALNHCLLIRCKALPTTAPPG